MYNKKGQDRGGRISNEKHEESEIEGKISNAPAELDLSNRTTFASEKKADIESHTEELKKSLANADKELVLKEKEIETEINKANEAMDAMRDIATTAIANIETGVNDSSKNIDSAFAKMRWTAKVVPIIVLVVYYVVYFIEYGRSYNPNIFGGLAIAVFIGIASKVVINRAYFKVSTTRNQATDTIKETNKGLGGFLMTRLIIEPDLARVKDNLASAAGYGQVMLSAVRDYVPALKGVYDSKERMNQQLIFIESLRNSLTAYGFDLTPIVNDYLSHFGPLSNSREEWIDAATEKLKLTLGTSQLILKMIFWDYVGDEESLKNVWKEIVSKPKYLTELSKLLISNNLVETEYIQRNNETYGAIENLIKDDKEFSLESFREKYVKYYTELAREKKALLDGLRDYNVTINQSLTDLILKFTPPSFEVEKRREALFSFASERIGFASDVLKLAYYEREGEVLKRSQTWNDLRRHHEQVSDFIVKLIDNKAIEVPTPYLANRPALGNFAIRVLTSSDDFTLSSAKRSLQLTFSFFEDQKAIYLRLMSNKIILSEVDREAFRKWLTPEPNPATIAKWIQGQTDVPDYVLLLLYYDYIQDAKERIKLFGSMREPEKMQNLSATLIERRFIPTSESTNARDEILNLSLLLTKLEDYNLSEIQLKFTAYNQLLTYSKELLLFLKEQQLIQEEASLDSEDVFNSVNPNITDPIIQEEVILDHLITSQGNEEFNSKEWHQPVTIATLAFYLSSRQSVLSPSACKKAGASDKASQILYQYSEINDEEEQRGATDKIKFAEIVRKTIDGTYTNYENLIPFKYELTLGFLFPRISQLLHVRMDNIKASIVNMARLEKTIKKYKDATNTFLESKIQANVVLESLRRQLISAYMITKLGAADVITGIIDEELPKACKELAKKDPIYDHFLLLSEDTIGPGIRVGIVPFQMDFTTFSKNFERVFQLAVANHSVTGSAHQPSEFFSNVVRFFPSDAFFKRVEGGGHASTELPSDHPAEIIRKLLLRHYGEVENLELIASVSGQSENSIALKSLLTTFFDTDTSIYLMAQKQLDVILGGSQFREYVESTRLDDGLCTSFKCSTRTSLATTICDLSGQLGGNNSIVQQRLRGEIERMADQSGARLNDEKVKQISEVVYQVLLDIGTVLRGFPSKD